MGYLNSYIKFHAIYPKTWRDGKSFRFCNLRTWDMVWHHFKTTHGMQHQTE